MCAMVRVDDDVDDNNSNNIKKVGGLVKSAAVAWLISPKTLIGQRENDILVLPTSNHHRSGLLPLHCARILAASQT